MSESLLEAISKACRGFENCIYAILFGSKATRCKRSFSDVDVTVMLDCDPNSALDVAAEIAQRLEACCACTLASSLLTLLTQPSSTKPSRAWSLFAGSRKVCR